MSRAAGSLAFASLLLSSCVSIDLTRHETEFDPPAATAPDADSLSPVGVLPSSTPPPNRAPDPSCYLYSGDTCVAPVIETTTLAPDPGLPVRE